MAFIGFNLTQVPNPEGSMASSANLREELCFSSKTKILEEFTAKISVNHTYGYLKSKKFVLNQNKHCSIIC